MVSVLQNQHINKRRKLHVVSTKKSNPKQKTIKQNRPYGTYAQPPKKRGHIHKLPVIFGLTLFLLCLFISSPYIFSLSFKQYSPPQLHLPGESHLTDYPDGYEYVQNLTDEREFGIIKISPKTTVQKKPPAHYIVEKGDTVYSISKKYDLSLYDLIRKNRISDPTKIKIGDILTFPSATYENTLLYNTTKSKSVLPDDIEIATNNKSGFAPFKITLKPKIIEKNKDSRTIRIGTTSQFISDSSNISKEVDKETLSYMWVLGNDRYLFDKEIEYVYKTPGVYNVFLIISDQHNTEVVSNKIIIDVKTKNTRKLYIETKVQQYMTVNQINEIINIATLTGLKKEEIKNLDIIQSPSNFQLIGDDQLLSIKAGYSKMTIVAEKKQFISHLFVSPLPSQHSYEPPYDWYKTQFATGINGNCGPSSVAMAIHWAKGIDIPVAKARSEIGLPFRDGAINFSHMFPTLKKHNVKADYTYINKVEDIQKIIDRGNIAIAVFNTKYISKVKGDPKKNLIGRHYNDNVGHYCIIKGYTLDGKYFIVYDPIPSDWTENSERYADGVSMIGKNRFYSTSELYKSMGKKVIEIRR